MTSTLNKLQVQYDNDIVGNWAGFNENLPPSIHIDHHFHISVFTLFYYLCFMLWRNKMYLNGSLFVSFILFALWCDVMEDVRNDYIIMIIMII